MIVLGRIGLKYDDYLFFRDTLERGGAMSHTVMFIHTASDPVVECTLVPDLSLAVAEKVMRKDLESDKEQISLLERFADEASQAQMN